MVLARFERVKVDLAKSAHACCRLPVDICLSQPAEACRVLRRAVSSNAGADDGLLGHKALLQASLTCPPGGLF